MIPAEFLESFQQRWNEILSSDEGEKVKRLLAIDGKTQRKTEIKTRKPIILSVPWMTEGLSGAETYGRKNE